MRGDLDGAADLLHENLKPENAEVKSYEERLAAQSNLANILACRGDVEGAKLLQQEAHKFAVQGLAPNHLHRLTYASNQASTLQRGAPIRYQKGEIKEALQDLREAEDL